MEDVAALVSCKDAGAEHIFAALDWRAVIVDGAAGGDVLLLERHSEIEVEIGAVEETHGKVQPKRRLTCSIRSSGAREMAANDRSPCSKCCRAASI